MKNFLLLTIFLIMGVVITNAQNNNLQDILYLKNGSIIRGLVIEQIPDKLIKIQTSDGSLFVYEIGEIEKMTKEPKMNWVTSKKNNKKSPVLSGICSFIIPGLGQFINGKHIQGVGFLVATGAFYAATENTDAKPDKQIFATCLLATCIWSIIDAVSGANKYNREHSMAAFNIGKNVVNLTPDIQLNRGENQNLITKQDMASLSYGFKLSMNF